MGLEAIEAIIRALNQKSGTKPYSTTAKVSKVTKDGRAWIRIDGAESDTPVSIANIECKRGDVVDVEVSHKGTRIAGNRTSPAVTVRTVEKVNKSVLSVRKMMLAEFVKAETLEAKMAVVEKLKADMATIGDLDVEGVLTLKGTIHQMDKSLTEAMNGIWGHFEEATDVLRDDEGEIVLDDEGNPIPVIKKVWVTDADVIAERLESDPGKWTGLAYNEAALSKAHKGLSEKVGVIESGVHISDDPANPHITIGKDGSDATLAMTNDTVELESKDEFGNVRHAFRVTSEATVAERMEVTNYMKVGRFALSPRLDGSLTLQYVG